VFVVDCKKIAFKINHNMPINLTGEDIMPIINSAWDKTFRNITSNKKQSPNKDGTL
jgi:hypothetical protein